MRTELVQAVATVTVAASAFAVALANQDRSPSVPRTVVVSAPASPSASPQAAVARRTPPAPPILRAARLEGLGRVVVDARGMTLYRSDADSAAPPRSRCVAACARSWRPVLETDGDLRVRGLDPTVVGTLTRADGRRQLTIAGWPVYRYAGDRRPGDVAGQCRGGFFAVTPQGGRSM